MPALLDTDDNRRIVDGLRAIGILLVIAFHVVVGLTRLLESDGVQDYMNALPGLMNIAWQALGSEIIFLFSGFLLSYLLLRELDRDGRIDIRSFYLKRVARIVPLYLVALAFYALLFDFEPMELLLNLLFVSKIFDATTIIPVGWSLEVMVQAYLLLPFVVLLLVRGRHTMLKALVAVILSLAVRFIALYLNPDSYQVPIYTFFFGGSVSDKQDDLYYLLLYRSTPFLLGFILAWLVRAHNATLERLLRGTAPVFLLFTASVVLVGVFGWLPFHNPQSGIHELVTNDFWLWYWTVQRFGFALGVSGFALCAWYARGRLFNPLRRILELGVWGRVSRNIYSIYLFHPLFLIPAAAIGFRTIEKEEVVPIHVLEVLATVVVAAVLSTLVAGLLTRFVEQPSQSWIRRRLL